MKLRSLTILMLAQIGALSLWFISAAILPSMLQEVDVSPFRQAALSSGVQVGFVIGALVSAGLGLSDRFDPRRVFAICAIVAGLTNSVLLTAFPGGDLAIFARVFTGVTLAGVYPVGMKIVVGWGLKDRGFLVGTLVAALTLGSALPHLLSFLGGADWKLVIKLSSSFAVISGISVLFTRLGPHHSTATRFEPRVILQAWTNKRVRFAYFGYFGHMWELYAMWAWIGAIALASYSSMLPAPSAQSLATLTAFIAIAAGGPMCVIAGRLADRFGKAEIAIISMVLSGTFAVLAALTFGNSVWISFGLFIFWGMAVVPDSALFSALVADASPPEQVGSLMTLQTAIGFALTFATVQAAPLLANGLGWPVVLILMALGPLVGVLAMVRLLKINQPQT